MAKGVTVAAMIPSAEGAATRAVVMRVAVTRAAAQLLNAHGQAYWERVHTVDLFARWAHASVARQRISVTASIAFAQQLRVDAIAVECILPSVARRGAARRASRAQERQFTCGVG